MKVLDRVLRAGDGKRVKALQSLVPEINALAPAMEALSDDALKGKTVEFRERLAKGETLDDILVEAFAVVREASFRVIGQRHFDVQLMGGAALHFGWVAEMKTGEGKTLVSTLPAYLNGLSGNGVHVITVNDYLARFHAEWMGRIHQWLGLSVGLVIPGLREDAAQKREDYACDITYGTNNEFGFDYLRDNMAGNLEEKVQRGHHFAIVDEVDSILIDEARTPLIISGRLADAAANYYKFAAIVRMLDRDVDYEVDESKRIVFPTESGVEKVEKELGLDNLYDSIQQNLVHQLAVALKAKELYRRDKDYIVDAGEVKIVDEFTGRVLEGRRWSEGIHQAVEAKENLRINEENQTLATITLQNYFRMYDKLAGMTGTAQTEAAELVNTYDLQVVPIPTNRAMLRVDEPDLIYKSEVAKFGAVVEDIVQRHALGQPILVGTISVEKSEYLSRELTKRGIRHEVLNAKQHTREAQIVAQAGRIGAVTVATNMAGRGTDVMLGGNAEFLTVEALNKRGLNAEETPEEYEQAWAAEFEKIKAQVAADAEQVLAAGGLYVLGTERHESRRIDNQLRGRSGRQGDVGESRFYLSLTDDLMRLFNSGAAATMMNRPGVPDDTAIESKIVSRAIQSAQSQVEGRNAEIRKNVLKYDDVMSRQRDAIYNDRRHILEGDDIQERIAGFLQDVVTDVVNQHIVEGTGKDWDLDALWNDLKTIYPVGLEISEVLAEAGNRNKLTREWLTRELVSDAKVAYEKRTAQIGEAAMRELERRVVLSVVDRKWRDHLYEMDYLKEGIGLRAMAQRDPLVEYQREGYGMFQQMMGAIKEEAVGFMFNIEVQVQAGEAVQQVKPDVKKLTYTSPSEDGSAEIQQGSTKKPDDKSGKGSSFFRN